MREIYGKRWVESYGSRVNGSWRQSLETMSQDEAMAGLRYLRKHADGRYVPTLGEFEQAVSAAMKPPPTHRKLPEPQGHREGRKARASEWVEQARQKLGVTK